MVNDDRKEVTEELGRVVYKLDTVISLLVDGKTIPAHEKLQGIKKIVINLRNHLVKEECHGKTKSN